MINRTKKDLPQNNDGNVAATGMYNQLKVLTWRSKNNHNK